MDMVPDVTDKWLTSRSKIDDRFFGMNICEDSRRAGRMRLLLGSSFWVELKLLVFSTLQSSNLQEEAHSLRAMQTSLIVGRTERSLDMPLVMIS